MWDAANIGINDGYKNKHYNLVFALNKQGKIFGG